MITGEGEEYVNRTEVVGRNAWHLDVRLATLLDAVRVRGGAILHIDWRCEPERAPRAAVVYRLPAPEFDEIAAE
jgi:hypothetical protein